MTDYDNLQATITRIQQMEQYMDTVLTAMDTESSTIDNDASIQEMIQELVWYMESGQWLQDYECDDRGELPPDLKRGVLSQDTLYDLLCEIKELEGK